MIDATPIGTYTKSQVSYLPDKNYFADWMTVKDIFDLFSDFYADFDRQKALRMCDLLALERATASRVCPRAPRKGAAHFGDEPQRPAVSFG